MSIDCLNISNCASLWSKCMKGVSTRERKVVEVLLTDSRSCPWILINLHAM